MIEQAHQQHPHLSIERLCDLFGVSRSWYYERGSQPESDAQEIALRDEIERIILEFSGYGYRRLTHALKRQGWQVNHKRVLRIICKTAEPIDTRLQSPTNCATRLSRVTNEGSATISFQGATKDLTKWKKVYILLIMTEQIQQLNAAQLAEIEATCACSNVRKAARTVTQLFDEVLQPTGLRSTQFTLLVAVARLREAPVTQLSRVLIMDRTTLTRNLKPLENQGLLTIEAGTDRRRHLVQLTERGRQALTSALPYWEQAQRQMVEHLGQEQWHTLRASLQATMSLAQSF